MSVDLGKFAEGFSSWRRMIASVPEVDAKATIFTNCANDVATYVVHGLSKAVAVDELHDIASGSGLVAARGEDMIQTTISDAFMRLDYEPRWPEPEAARTETRAPTNGGTPSPGAVTPAPLPPIMSKAAFLARYGKPPDYLVDDVLQKGFIYALTGQTGHAKTAVALLLARLVASPDPNAIFGTRKIAKGRVVYFVGENPDDVSIRIKGSDAVRADLADDDDISFVPGIFDIERMMAALEIDAKKNGGISLIIVDTSAAYFLGNEELSNTQMGAYARVLRKLTTLPGHPCVVVLCHPIKHVVDPSQLLPRGGSAYLAEMDGNLTLWRVTDDTIELSYTKLRGPSFQPVSFQLRPIKTPSLVDAKGRQFSTIEAVVVSRAEEEAAQNRETEEEDQILAAMLKLPEGRLSDWADHLGWVDGKGESYKVKVQRIIEQRLDKQKPKMVTKNRRRWVLTDEGKAQARQAALKSERIAHARAQPKLL